MLGFLCSLLCCGDDNYLLSAAAAPPVCVCVCVCVESVVCVDVSVRALGAAAAILTEEGEGEEIDQYMLCVLAVSIAELEGGKGSIDIAQ